MKLFERAVVRAGLPLRWGQGFNPHPRLSLPLPRPVGVASESDLLVVELEDVPGPQNAPNDAMSLLAGQMPAGVALMDARVVRGVPAPQRVRYSVPLDAPPGDLPARINALLAQPTCIIERAANASRPARPVDIRPYIETVTWDDSRGQLTWTLKVTTAGTARPAEVLSALGLPVESLAHRILREHVEWNFGPLPVGEGGSGLPGPGEDAQGNSGAASPPPSLPDGEG